MTRFEESKHRRGGDHANPGRFSHKETSAPTTTLAVRPATHVELEAALSFGTVVRVGAGGVIERSPHGADCLPVSMVVELDEDGRASEPDDGDLANGWRWVAGRSQKDGNLGLVFDQSETANGELADEILEEPGDYCAIGIEVDDPEAADDEPLSFAGWALAHKPA